MAIDLSELIITAEIVTVVGNPLTLRDEALIYLCWLGLDGKDLLSPSFVIVEIE